MASLNNIGASASDTSARSLNERLTSAVARTATSRADRAAANPTSSAPGLARTAADTVQLSPAALAANSPGSIDELTPERAALVQSVRAQIDRDEYLSNEKLSIALDRLIDDALGIG